DSAVVFENYPVSEQRGIRDLDATEATNYALTVVGVPGETLTLGIGYDPELFDDTTVRRMVGHLTRVVEAMCDNPTLGDLDVPKARAACLPADPAYPAQRIEFMMSAAKPVLVVTMPDTAGAFGRHTGEVVMDGSEASCSGEPVTRSLSPASPAYVIYTSGSTG